MLHARWTSSEHISAKVQRNEFLCLVQSGDEYRECKEQRRKRERTCGVEIMYEVFDGICMKVDPIQVCQRLR